MMALFGMYRGLVVAISDPTGKGRLQVQVPSVNGTGVLNWAMPCLPVGGMLALPKVGDPVWIAFEAGDPGHPVWLGTWKVA